MSTFSEDDVGKKVVNDDGTAIGYVATVGGGTALVETNPGLADSIRAALGWESGGEDAVPLADDAVREITDDAVHLEGGSPSPSRGGSETDEGIDRDEGGGRRDVGPTTEPIGETGDEGGRVESESGADRHPDAEDAPPEGDRTVTREWGEEEDR